MIPLRTCTKDRFVDTRVSGLAQARRQGVLRVANDNPDRGTLELQVLAQIRDSLTGLNVDMREVREKVIRLEERDQRVSALEQTIAKLDTRVDVLLKDKDRRDGAVSMGQAVVKHLPSLSLGAILTALAAWFSKTIH